MAPRLRWLLVLSASIFVSPALAHGQDKAGVVTTLEGNVTATRGAVAQPVALKFKDDVFLNDRITTGDRSTARLLLGGKAVVTVRERSSLTITEIPGQSTIDLDSGKIAVAVAREKMRPGERLEVRTPNAVAGVRGTVFVVEVTRATAQGPTQGPTQSPTLSLSPGVATTLVYHYEGSLLLRFAEAPGVFTRQVVVNAGEIASGTGFAQPTRAIMTPDVAARGRAGFQTTLRNVGGATLEPATSQAVESTVTALSAAGFAAALIPSSPPPVPSPPQLPQNVLLPGGQSTLTGFTPPSVFPDLIQLSPSMLPFKVDPGTASTPRAVVTGATVSAPTETFFSLPAGVTSGLVRPLLGATNAALTATALLNVGGTLASTGSGALVATDPTTMTFTGDVFAVPGSLVLIAPLMTDTGGTLKVAENVLGVNGTLASTTASGLFQLTNSTVGATDPAAEPGRFLEVAGTAVLAGSLLSASTSSLTLANVVEVSSGHLVGTGSTSLVDLNGGSLTVLKREADPENPTRIEEDGLFMGVEAGGTVTLAGQLLKAQGTTLAMGTLLELEGGSLVSTTLAPLVELIDSPLRSQGRSYDGVTVVERWGGLMDIAGTMTLAGPLFKATRSPIVTGDAFEVDGTLTSTTTAALIQLVDSSLRAEEHEIDDTAHAVFLRVGGTGTVRLAGSLLNAKNSALTILDALVRVQAGGQIITTGTTDPLVALTGATHSITGSLFELTGSATGLDPVEELVVGSDRPVQHGAVLFETSGATVSASQAVRLDTALFEAMAPVLNLTAGSALTTALDTVNLVNKAKLVANVPADALVKLNASTLTVTSGSLLNVANGSYATITGNLLKLDNGSTLTITNGALVTISGGSVFTLTGGSLAAFGSGSNVLNITATPACVPCGSVRTDIPNLLGVPVLLAPTASLTVKAGFVPFVSGTPSVTAGAAVLVVKDTSRVKLGF